MVHGRFGTAVLAAGLALTLSAASAVGSEPVEEVTVTGQPLPNLLIVPESDIATAHAGAVSDLIADFVPGAILSDTEANPFQEDLYFRGYDASPVLGTAVGLAVYQNGVRINERFGDTVLWDLIPTFAMKEIEVVTGSDPLFGLNALGGAVVLDLKDGFGATGGTTVALSSGSFARTRATVEYAENYGDAALYTGLSLMHDGGWRRHSASDLAQAYGDYSVTSGPASAGVSLTLATDFLNENAAVPVGDDPRAAFSIPDTAQDSTAFLAAHFEEAPSNTVTIRIRSYFRWTDLRTANGEAFGFVPCTSDPTLLCTDDDPDDPLTAAGGGTIPASSGADGTDGLSHTITSAAGASTELDWSGSLLGLANATSLGLEGDFARTDFRSSNALATVTVAEGGVTAYPIGVSLGGPEFNIGLRALNDDVSAFVQDTMALTGRLSFQAGVRADFDRIALTDQEGGALTARHGYGSVNPQATITWSVSNSASLYASAGQSNRTPTAAELSCANAAQPCLFPLSFISDPGLKQVFARSVELGARGMSHWGEFTLDWLADAYLSRNENDILFVSAGPAIGSGYFANVGATQRLGSETSLKLAWRDFAVSANAGFVDATFRSTFAEQSPFNPGADANGIIFVQPGDRLPNVPRFTGRVTVAWQATPDLSLRMTANLQSARFLRGDEANLESPLPGFVVFGLDAEYRFAERLSAFIEAENIFDARYASFGLYGDPTAAGTLPQFTNPRFVVPAEPFGVWAGLALHL